MSLINQMLKDLEKRRAGEPDATAAPLRGVSNYVVARSKPNWLLYLAGLLILLLLATVGWLGWERYQAAPVPAPTASAEPPAVTAGASQGADEPGVKQSGPPAEPAAGSRQSRKVPAAPVKSPPHRSPVPVAVPEPDTAPASPVIKRSRPQSKTQRAEAAYQRGYQQLAAGRQDLAEQSLREALQLAPGHEHARELLAGLLIRQGRYVEAGDILQAGLAANPGHARFAMLQARVRLAQAQLDEAVRVLERRPPTLQANPDYYALLAALYQRQGNHEAAARIYRQLLELRPEAGNWQVGLGVSLEALGDTAGARQAYQAAVQNPGLPTRLGRYARTRLDALQDEEL
jgi:MSHA biogenesis protein MshN